MADLLEHVAQLSQEIGPRPAGTEEEQQAALYIADQFRNDAGLKTEVEDFDRSPNSGLPMLICCACAFVVAVLALFLPVMGVIAIIVTVVVAVLYVLEAFDIPVLTRLFARGVSQNVVAKYEPSAQAQSGNSRRRKVILVARYDSGKVRTDLSTPIVRFLPVLRWVELAAMVLLPVFLIFRCAVFVSDTGIVSLIFGILIVLALIVVAEMLVFALLHELSSYNEAANCNASGTAVMLEVARRVGTGRTSATTTSAPEAVIHGEAAARAENLVPENAPIAYETTGYETAGTTPQEPAPYEPSIPSSASYEAAPATPHEAAPATSYEGAPNSPESRLAAAKAAVAALSGEPEAAYMPDLSQNLAQAKEPPVGAPTEEAIHAMRSETREAFTQPQNVSAEAAPVVSENNKQAMPNVAPAVPTNTGEAASANAGYAPNAGQAASAGYAPNAVPSATRTDAAPAASAGVTTRAAAANAGVTSRAAATPDASPVFAAMGSTTPKTDDNVPSWYKAAQEKAKRPAEESKPVQGSYFTTALDAAVGETTQRAEESSEQVGEVEVVETIEQAAQVEVAQPIEQVAPAEAGAPAEPATAPVAQRPAAEPAAEPAAQTPAAEAAPVEPSTGEPLDASPDAQAERSASAAVSHVEPTAQPAAAEPVASAASTEAPEPVVLEAKPEAPAATVPVAAPETPEPAAAPESSVPEAPEPAVAPEANAPKADEFSETAAVPAAAAPEISAPAAAPESAVPEAPEPAAAPEASAPEAPADYAPDASTASAPEPATVPEAPATPDGAPVQADVSNPADPSATTAMPPIDLSEFSFEDIPPMADITMPSFLDQQEAQNETRVQQPDEGRNENRVDVTAAPIGSGGSVVLDDQAQAVADQTQAAAENVQATSSSANAQAAVAPDASSENIEANISGEVAAPSVPATPTAPEAAAPSAPEAPEASETPLSAEDTRPVDLSAAGVSAADLKPITEMPKQRAPLADAEESGKTAAKNLLNMLPSINVDEVNAAGTSDDANSADSPHSKEEINERKAALRTSLPSLSGAIRRSDPSSESSSSSVSLVGSFVPAAGATGSIAPVGDELLENVDPDDIYVEDADDSAFEENITETGAYAGPGYVDMPKSRVGRLFGRFGRKKNDEESSTQEWLDVDESFDARTVGAERGGWESFRNEEGAGAANEAGASSQAPNEAANQGQTNDAYVDDEGSNEDFSAPRPWQGGAFSVGRARSMFKRISTPMDEEDVSAEEFDEEQYDQEIEPERSGRRGRKEKKSRKERKESARSGRRGRNSAPAAAMNENADYVDGRSAYDDQYAYDDQFDQYDFGDEYTYEERPANGNQPAPGAAYTPEGQYAPDAAYASASAPMTDQYAQAPEAAYAQNPEAAYAPSQGARYQTTQAPNTYGQSPNSYSQASGSYGQAPSAAYTQTPDAAYAQTPEAAYAQTPEAYGQTPNAAYAQTPEAAYAPSQPAPEQYASASAPEVSDEMQQVYQFHNPDINTEVWFVALGSELSYNAGMRAFLDEHEQELHGSIIIDLDAMGAGELSLIEREGVFRRKKISSRMKRYTRSASQATGVRVNSADLLWEDSAASIANKRGFQAMHLVGMENGKPARYGQADDIFEGIDEVVLQGNTDFIMEVLKNI